MRNFFIIDTTLRDGEQAPGVDFSRKNKIEIAKKLSESNIDIIEIGIPAMGDVEIEIMKEINSMKLYSELLTWNRTNKKDIDAAYKTGIKNTHISIPVSDIQIDKKLKKTKKELLFIFEDVLNYTKDKNLDIFIGMEDASRADENFIDKILEISKKYKVKRVRYADTLGILTPIKTYNIIKKIKSKLNIDIDFHGHNDFGMATANALSAFNAGARYISTSVNGIGERAGNVALEELLAVFYYIEKIEPKIDIKKIVELSKIVEKYSGIKLSKNKPIVGDMVFSHESGIHVDGLLKDRRNYEFIKPEDIGREMRILFGKHSGKQALIYEK